MPPLTKLEGLALVIAVGMIAIGLALIIENIAFHDVHINQFIQSYGN